MAVLPLISVVIPMHNEALHIRACIDSVLAQDYPPDRMEILAVDGGSADDTGQIVGEYARRTGRVRLLHNPHRVVPYALNIGIRAARGDIVARVDAHTTLAPDYLRAGVEALARSGAENVGGPMVARGGGLVGDAVALATGSRFGIGAYFHYGDAERLVDTVYMGMWPRSVFAKVGLFDEELVRNQDDEFNYRLRKLGGRILITPAMRSSYQNRQDLRGLWRQFYQYGTWKVRVCQKHPRQMSWRHLVPPAFVACAAVTPPLWPLSHPMGAAGAAVSIAYLAVLAAVSGRIAWGRSIRLFGCLPIVFGTIHIAWGLGFLVGLARFAPHWFRAERQPPQLAGEQGGGAASIHRS